MRLLIAALVALGMSLGFANCALAQPALKSCDEVPQLAADVMKSRQVNYDIMLMLNRMSSELFDRIELVGWAEAMIDMAYSQPIATTPEARAQQVEAFQTLWNERCISKLQH